MSPTIVRRKWCSICLRHVPVEVTMLTAKPCDFRREVAWAQALDRELTAEFERTHVARCGDQQPGRKP